MVNVTGAVRLLQCLKGAAPRKRTHGTKMGDRHNHVRVKPSRCQRDEDEHRSEAKPGEGSGRLEGVPRNEGRNSHPYKASGLQVLNLHAEKVVQLVA